MASVVLRFSVVAVITVPVFRPVAAAEYIIPYAFNDPNGFRNGDADAVDNLTDSLPQRFNNAFFVISCFVAVMCFWV